MASSKLHLGAGHTDSSRPMHASDAVLGVRRAPRPLALDYALPVGGGLEAFGAALAAHELLAAGEDLPVVSAQLAHEQVVGRIVRDVAADEDDLGAHLGVHHALREGPESREDSRRLVDDTVAERLWEVAHQQIERLTSLTWLALVVRMSGARLAMVSAECMEMVWCRDGRAQPQGTDGVPGVTGAGARPMGGEASILAA